MSTQEDNIKAKAECHDVMTKYLKFRAHECELREIRPDEYAGALQILRYPTNSNRPATVFCNDKIPEKVLEYAAESSLLKTWTTDLSQCSNILTWALFIHHIEIAKDNQNQDDPSQQEQIIPRTVEYIKVRSFSYQKDKFFEKTRKLYPNAALIEWTEADQSYLESQKYPDRTFTLPSQWIEYSRKRGLLLKHLDPLPSLSFLRPETSAVFMVKSQPEGEEVVMIVRPHPAVAQFAYEEIPSGHFNAAGEFEGESADLIREYLGITINQNNVLSLTQLSLGDERSFIYPSPGGCSERIHVYLYRIEDNIRLRNSLTSSIKLEPVKSLYKVTTDCKSLVALNIYQEYKRGGML
eukprot:c5025_g1_i1.p1 GENE.c5025_g1_i1~~c5025_g1_i1.p1  ORF type:complete len:352 (-),score=49.59 c5025_g1_i1:64-1119(-)